MKSIEAIAQDYVASANVEGQVAVRVGDCVVRLRADRSDLVDELRAYFDPWLCEESVIEDRDHVVDVLALEVEVPPFEGASFVDWPRDPGKVGRKEAIYDEDGCRIVRKVRTGMHFLLGPDFKVAIGPCRENSNQVINFVNAQVLNHFYGGDAALCHSAGVVMPSGTGIGISGFSGGGKSTLALWLVGDGADFVSNDRLLIRDSEPPRMIGVPKLPRINPGTLLNNPALGGILPPERTEELRSLPTEQIWDLEEKYDVDIDRQFGRGHVRSDADLHAFFVLSWDRSSDEPTRIERVDLAKRRELIAAIRKPPGPFWLGAADGSNPPSAPVTRSDDDYVHAFRNIEVFEIRGRVDFDAARAFAREQFADRVSG